MSRIDEALRRMSTAPTEQGVPCATAERPVRRLDGGVLETYPAEEGALPFESELPPPPVSKPAPAPAPDRPVQRVEPVFETRMDTKLVVSPTCDPMLLEQYRRLAAAVHELQIERGLKTM